MADPNGPIEELAAQNLKPMALDPCASWDRMVEARMARDGCDRSVAIDRVLSEPGGSSAWLTCQQYDARQPKILPDGTKSGNWKNQGNGVARRVPRHP
jgi:hypothetical protein